MSLLRRMSRANATDVVNFLFQRVFGINRRVRWAVHFTSVVIAAEKISIQPCGSILKSFARSPGCYIQAENGIIFGADVLFGPHVKIISQNHNTMSRRAPSPDAPPVRIHDNCWLGAGVTVLPGVELGQNCVVGAGAVVTHSFPPDVVIAGNPARIIRELVREAEEQQCPA